MRSRPKRGFRKRRIDTDVGPGRTGHRAAVHAAVHSRLCEERLDVQDAAVDAYRHRLIMDALLLRR